VFKVLLAGVLAVALAIAPGHAQPAHQSPRAGSFALLVGLPVFTSDGRRIGVVTGFAHYHGQALLIAEIEQPLGIGPDKVAIPSDMFVRHTDRVELTLTAEQVKDRLTEPPPKR
jgi:hypothetical protein